MKQRVIALCIVFAMIISFIPHMAVVGCASSFQSGNATCRLRNVEVYDSSNALIGDYQFSYDEKFLTGVTSKTYGDYAYESSMVLSYDDAGRLVSRISGDPDTPGMNSGMKYTYDGAGNLIGSLQWEGGAVEKTYEYNSAGKCIKEIEKSDTSSKVTVYQYDADGLVTSAVETIKEEWSGNTWSAVVSYSYDLQKRVTAVSTSGGQVNSTTTYSYLYEPFILSSYSDSTGYSYSYLLLQDGNGKTLYSFYLNSPELHADENGNLGKVVDTESLSNQVKTYVFYYDCIEAELEDTSIIQMPSEWNQVYYDYIVEDRNTSDWKSETYELIYIDNDDVPEIWIYYEPTGQRGELISYQDGHIVKVSTGRWDFEYAQSNKYFHCAGGTFGTGGCWDVIYALDGGQFKEVASGSYVSETGNYDETVVYTWDGQIVAEELYQSNIDQYLDPEITKRTYSDDSEIFDYEGILDYLSSMKIDETAELKVYTTFPYATLGIDQTAKLLITLLVNGETTPIQEFALGNNNPEIIELVDTKDADGVRVLTFKTKSPGVANLTFTEGATGATISIEIAVEEMCSYYRCSNFPIPDASSFPIHVAGFQCTENPNGTHSVKFNAYNTSYAYGAAIVYDEAGNFWGCVPLNPKYDGTGMEYVANGFWQSWEQTKNFFVDDKVFYEVPGNAMLTEVEFDNIPNNAKIIITADGKESVYPILYTGIDIFLKVAFYTSNIDLKVDVYQKSVKGFLDAMLKALPSDAAQNTIQTLTTDISKALFDGVNGESVDKIYQAIWNMFKNLGLNADEMIKDVLSGLGYSVADTVIIAAVPAYSFVDLVNKLVAVAWLFVDYDSNYDRGKMEVHCIGHTSSNQLINSSVVVIQQSSFSENTVLDAYLVTDTSELEILSASIDSDVENFSVFNITLRESGAEIQPKEEIEIRIPIPENVSRDKCVVYRIEDDNTMTLLPSKIEEGYIVFNSTHLSYYLVCESNIKDNVQEMSHSSLWVVLVGFVVCITTTIALNKARPKRKRKTGKYER